MYSRASYSHSLGALDALGKELAPNLPPVAASVEYRKSLAISLFYKVRPVAAYYYSP